MNSWRWIAGAVTLMVTLGMAAGQQASSQSSNREELVRRTSNTWNKSLDFPSKTPEVTASIVQFAPGAVGRHQTNPYPRYIYVLEGTLTFDLDDGESVDFPAGSFIISGNTWLTPRNKGTVAAKMLLIDQTEAGHQNVTTHVMSHK
jgi:quercetin dioxygenase-like cupin family protein